MALCYWGSVRVVYESLDVEAERGADSRDVLAVELLENRRLPGVVEAEEQQLGVLVHQPER